MIFFCCRERLKQILQKEGREHEEVFGTDVIPQVNK
jgi:hypothetical protein